MLTKAGVLYYEVELLSEPDDPQIGFATDRFRVGTEETSSTGVGDDEQSWGVDGIRNAIWCERKANAHDDDWPGDWDVGDVIGFAANVDAGRG